MTPRPTKPARTEAAFGWPPGCVAGLSATPISVLLDPRQRGVARRRGPVFQTDMALVAARVDRGENVAVVDLARARLVSARGIRDLDVSHAVEEPAVGIQQFALHPLQVIEVEL